MNGHIAIKRGAVAELRPGILRDGEVTDAPALAEALKTFFAENDLPKPRPPGRGQPAHRRALARPAAARGREGARRRRPRRGAGPHPDADGRGDPRLRPARAGPDRRRPAHARGDRRRPPRADRPPGQRDQGRRPEGRGHRPRRLRHGARARRQGASEGAVLYINVAGLTNVAVANQSGCLFTRAAAGGLSAIVATLAERRSLTLEHSRMWIGHVGLATPLDVGRGRRRARRRHAGHPRGGRAPARRHRSATR